MTTIARAFSRIFIPTTGTLDNDNLIKIAMFCGAGLLISLLVLYGGGQEFLYF
jgi:hypothetical protein